jgi:hypothetical protein
VSSTRGVESTELLQPPARNADSPTDSSSASQSFSSSFGVCGDGGPTPSTQRRRTRPRALPFPDAPTVTYPYTFTADMYTQGPGAAAVRATAAAAAAAEARGRNYGPVYAAAMSPPPAISATGGAAPPSAHHYDAGAWARLHAAALRRVGAVEAQALATLASAGAESAARYGAGVGARKYDVYGRRVRGTRNGSSSGSGSGTGAADADGGENRGYGGYGYGPGYRYDDPYLAPLLRLSNNSSCGSGSGSGGASGGGGLLRPAARAELYATAATAYGSSATGNYGANGYRASSSDTAGYSAGATAGPTAPFGAQQPLNGTAVPGAPAVHCCPCRAQPPRSAGAAAPACGAGYAPGYAQSSSYGAYAPASRASAAAADTGRGRDSSSGKVGANTGGGVPQLSDTALRAARRGGSARGHGYYADAHGTDDRGWGGDSSRDGNRGQHVSSARSSATPGLSGPNRSRSRSRSGHPRPASASAPAPASQPAPRSAPAPAPARVDPEAGLRARLTRPTAASDARARAVEREHTAQTFAAESAAAVKGVRETALG